jgi:hypothetical protein
MMFYIVVTKDETQKVVADSEGEIREFPKRKKAQNFVDGRVYLKDPQIVTAVDGIRSRLNVEL